MLFLKAYHEFARPFELLRQVRTALRPSGRLGVIDRDGNGADHGVNADKVIQELRQAGFSLVSQYDFVKKDGDDYFLIFK